MSSRLVDHLYIFGMLFCGVLSQLIMRWQAAKAGQLPDSLYEKLIFVLHLLINPWVLCAMVATFMSGVFWLIAMTKFELSYAYPWASLNFVLVLLFSVLFLGECFSGVKLLGTALVILGLLVLTRG